MIFSCLIANYHITFNMEYDEYFQSALSPYSAPSSDNTDIYFKIEKTDTAPALPEDIPRRTIGENKYYCFLNDNDIVYYFDTKLDKIIALTSFSEDYSKIKITALNISLPELSNKFFIYNLVGYAMHYVIQMKGGFVFHSSSVSCNGNGIAFSANSGTGKTTHTSLWLQNISNCAILNDDTPIIRINGNDDVYIYGTPWAGTSGRNTNLSVPLKALVFLKRGQKNEIHKISPEAAIKPFFQGVLPPLTPNMLSNALNSIDKIFSVVPAYLLTCNMEPEAAKLAYNTIFSK